MRRKNVSEEEIAKRISQANRISPDILVKNYELLINTMELPIFLCLYQV